MHLEVRCKIGSVVFVSNKIKNKDVPREISAKCNVIYCLPSPAARKWRGP